MAINIDINQLIKQSLQESEEQHVDGTVATEESKHLNNETTGFNSIAIKAIGMGYSSIKNKGN